MTNEFVKHLRRLPAYRDTPVFFITGRETEPERYRAATLGAAEFFAKPVVPEMLIQAMDKFCIPPVDH